MTHDSISARSRLAGLLTAVLLVGCAAEPLEQRPEGSRARDLLAAAIGGSVDSDEDDWARAWGDGSTALADPLGADGSTDDAAAVQSGPVWSIVLNTFSGEGHQQAAATMVSQLPRISPELASAWAHQTPRGSVVAYGRYEGVDDPAAQRDLKAIKALQINGRPVFARAMLSRLQRGVAAARTPFQLMSVRQRYPKVDPLYTLQVAVWGAFGGAMALGEAQRRAEAQVMALRAEGAQAYVHHDVDSELSMVTIGLFDHRALNPRSGLYSPEVETLLRRFPAHLVNGQPVTNPSTGERQSPSLVLVPEL